ncbi:hypothetical protein [Bradyrhizobium sp. I1.7.5]|uniref:hypothetical protein n=1 Tax=Bradyrhizobium sp. I1.7.5 TaxID=3156363 RepID=UPI00339B26FC
MTVQFVPRKYGGDTQDATIQDAAHSGGIVSHFDFTHPILRSLSALQDDVEPTERDATALRYNRNGTISPKISTFDGAGLRSLKSSAKLDVP